MFVYFSFQFFSVKLTFVGVVFGGGGMQHLANGSIESVQQNTAVFIKVGETEVKSNQVQINSIQSAYIYKKNHISPHVRDKKLGEGTQQQLLLNLSSHTHAKLYF